MTPYWSIRSNSSKDVELDQIILADTGGAESTQNLKKVFNNMAELQKYATTHTRTNSLGSVRKRLVFNSKDQDQDFVSAL